jgi:MATE family multidrug resistance protein
MATRVGHAIGSGDRDRVTLAVWCGTSITLAVGFACMLVLLTAPGLIISAYTSDPAINQIAINLIRLAAVFIIIDSVQVAASFCLRAFKDTRFPFVVMCVVYWLITLPLGYWLGIVTADDALSGTAGFWKSMILGIALSSVLVVGRLYRTLQRPLHLAAGPGAGSTGALP